MKCSKGGARPAGRNSFHSKVVISSFASIALLNFNTGIMEGGTGDRTTREVNLDRLRPRGVKRRLTTENDASTKGVNKVRRKRQKGQQPEEEEEEEDEVDEDGREEMERLVGLVPSLMGREGSVSQVRPGILVK